MKISQAFIFLLVGVLPAVVLAEDRTIQSLMEEYWAAWTSQDFEKAASFISPIDLSDAKAALVPVFLEAQNQSSEDTREIVSTFFGQTRGEDRKSLSGEQVFVGLNRVIATAMADSFDILSRISVRVTKVIPDGDDSSVFRYDLLLDGEVLAEDFERIVKINGNWYLRFKEDPKVTARKFELIFRE